MGRVASIKHVRDRPAVQKDGSTQSCVQYQDARARVVLQMAQEAHRALTIAASDNNAAERAYQSGRLVMLDDMLKAVQKSAQLCIQEEMSTVNVVKVDVEVDDDRGGAKGDPTAAPPTTLSVERPTER